MMEKIIKTICELTIEQMKMIKGGDEDPQKAQPQNDKIQEEAAGQN